MVVACIFLHMSARNKHVCPIFTALVSRCVIWATVLWRLQHQTAFKYNGSNSELKWICQARHVLSRRDSCHVTSRHRAVNVYLAVISQRTWCKLGGHLQWVRQSWFLISTIKSIVVTISTFTINPMRFAVVSSGHVTSASYGICCDHGVWYW